MSTHHATASNFTVAVILYSNYLRNIHIKFNVLKNVNNYIIKYQ